jgi:hypothetical protein
MYMKNLFAAVASVAIAGLSTSAMAGIIALAPAGASSFPSAVPTLNVEPGGSISLSLWAQAQGSGYLQNMNLAVFEGSAASWAGGQITASNVFPSVDFVTGLTTSAPLASQFAAGSSNSGVQGSTLSNTGTTGSVNAPTTGYAAGAFPWTFSGQNSVDPGAGAIRSTGVQIATLTGTVGVVPGTYYLYLGRVGGGIIESPAFKAAGSFVGGLGTGASVSNTTQFGFGSELPVGTGGAGPNGTGANTLSALPDAIIVVAAPVSNPTVSLTPGGVNPAVVPGNGESYLPTLANSGAFSFAGSNAGATLVAFDLSGADGVPANLVLPSGAALAPEFLALFNGNLGGGFDFVVNFGALGSGPFTAAISNLGAGVTVGRVAAIPEPAALGVLAPVALLAARRRRA